MFFEILLPLTSIFMTVSDDDCDDLENVTQEIEWMMDQVDNNSNLADTQRQALIANIEEETEFAELLDEACNPDPLENQDFFDVVSSWLKAIK
ncbi:MAG: hypothetical protein AAF250_10685 [Pseudomonadota bacterium]